MIHVFLLSVLLGLYAKSDSLMIYLEEQYLHSKLLTLCFAFPRAMWKGCPLIDNATC